MFLKWYSYILNNFKFQSAAKDSKNIVVKIIAGCWLCLFAIIENYLSYLVGNAYVIVAKEGTPFYDSGKRGFKLLMNNICDVIALNRFGDIVLFVCRLLIVLIAGFVGYAVISQVCKSHIWNLIFTNRRFVFFLTQQLRIQNIKALSLFRWLLDVS